MTGLSRARTTLDVEPAIWSCAIAKEESAQAAPINIAVMVFFMVFVWLSFGCCRRLHPGNEAAAQTSKRNAVVTRTAACESVCVAGKIPHSPPVTILETERLALRELDAEGDAEFMVEVLNEPAFIKYVADRGVRTPADATSYIQEKMLPSYAKYGFGFYVVELKDSRVPIGICGLIKREALDDVDIGFSTLREYWGRGYAYEAASALMERGRRLHGLPRIAGIADPDNKPSI